MHERSLIPHQSVVGIVATYQQARKEITKAFGLLDKAKKRLKLTAFKIMSWKSMRGTMIYTASVKIPSPC